MLWGRAPPRPEAKTPRPSTLAWISHAIQSEAECSPGGAATRRLEIAAACAPAPSARAPTTNPPSLNCARRHAGPIETVCWRLAWMTTRALLGTTRTHACVVDCCQCTCEARRLRICCQGAERARLKQKDLYLLQTRCGDHMTHEQQCQHTVCRKTNCPSCSLSALSAAEVPDLVAPPW